MAEHQHRCPPSDGLVRTPFECAPSRPVSPSGTLRPKRSQQPSVPWPRVAAVRDQLTHRYLGLSHAIVGQTGGADLAELLAATESLLAVLDAPD